MESQHTIFMREIVKAANSNRELSILNNDKMDWDLIPESNNILNREDFNMNFGQAIEAMEAGDKVSREGWNGKGMFLYLVPANSYPAQTNAAKEYWGKKDVPHTFVGDDKVSVPLVPWGAYIAMKTAQENVVPWLASQTDILAKDWGIIA